MSDRSRLPVCLPVATVCQQVCLPLLLHRACLIVIARAWTSASAAPKAKCPSGKSVWAQKILAARLAYLELSHEWAKSLQGASIEVSFPASFFTRKYPLSVPSCRMTARRNPLPIPVSPLQIVCQSCLLMPSCSASLLPLVCTRSFFCWAGLLQSRAPLLAPYP